MISTNEIMLCLPGAEQQSGNRSQGFSTTTRGTNIAIIEMVGLMDGAMSARLQDQILAAGRNESVGAITLLIDSPGGYASAAFPLAEVVREVAARKPIHAYVGSVCASGAYMVAANATTITASEWAAVGSIGTYVLMADTSELFKRMGVKTLVVRAGRFKGIGIPGTAIKEEELEEIGRVVDDTNRLFLAGVSRGRSIPMKTMIQEIATGQVWIGRAALERRLVDQVASLSQFIGTMQKRHPDSAEPLVKTRYIPEFKMGF